MKRLGMMDRYTTKIGGLSTERPNLVPLALFPLAVLICVFLAACGASVAPQPTLQSEDVNLVLWPRGEQAIGLRVSTDRDLNFYDSKAHSIQVCVYQFDKPDAFLNLAKTPEGIETLLKAEFFDKSVKDVARLFMQPFEETALKLDRAENATFVGIVCGYFDSTPENSAKVWEIKPQVTTTGSLFWKTTVYSAGTLDIALRLTARAMAEEGEAPIKD